MSTTPEPEPLRGPVLGIDYGTVRVGLALGDPESGLVLALPVLAHPGEEPALITRLAEIARERDAAVVLLGNPLHVSGEESEMSRRVGLVRDALAAELNLPVELMDERRTSVDAESQLSQAGLRWWQYEKGRLDAMAAMAIVRDYLYARDPSLALQPEEPATPPPDPRQDRRARRRRAQKRQRRDRED